MPSFGSAARYGARLLYFLVETVAGLLAALMLGSLLLLPLWLLAWPRLEERLVPLSGNPSPRVQRRAWELRWRDWALVFLCPVAGVVGGGALAAGIVYPGLVAAGGVPGHPALAVALVVLFLVLAPILARAWGRLTSALLDDDRAALAGQLRALSDSHARTQDAIALERRQLERDLHDGVQVHLGASGLSLAALQLDVESLPDGARRTAMLGALADAQGQLAAASGAVRRAARGLVPVALRDGGLCPALRDLATQVPLTTTLVCDAVRLPDAVEEGLFFIAAESLANAAHHSGATRLEVRLDATGDRARLVLSDDGVGGAEPTGTGLLGIASRARVLGGRADITSPPGRGTVVSVVVPVGSDA